MSEKSEIVKAALKLISGGLEGTSARAAGKIERKAIEDLVKNPEVDLTAVRDRLSTEKFHKDLMDKVAKEAARNEGLIRRLQDAGAFKFPIGTRYTTSKSRESALPPWEVTGYYVNPQNPKSYGYRIRRPYPGGYEETHHMIRDPGLEILHGPEKWKRLQEEMIPYTGPKPAPKKDGGRTGYGPGGVIDDIVKMAGKIVSGAEKTPAFKMPPIRPSTDNLSDVGYSNFDHFEFGGDKMLPIENLSGGVNLSDPSQRKRVDALKSAISNPDTGYISRLVVDQDGNVIEGQHRLEALRESRAAEVPVSILRDKTAGIDIPKLKAAITSQGGIHSDNVNQLVDMLMDADQYDPPPGFEKFWDAGLKELGSQKGRTGYGPGGFVDDVVKMAGKIVSGADEPAKTGIRAYHGSPHDYPAERLVVLPDNLQQYIVGAPNMLPKIPEGATVLQDFPLGRMRMDKIGTGEGNQSFGHGLYTAEAEPVAQSYRYMNARIDPEKVTYGGKPIQWHYDQAYKNKDRLDRAGASGKIMSDANARAALWENMMVGNHPDKVLQDAMDNTIGWPELNAYAASIDKGKFSGVEVPGSMYEVRINANPDDFLDWDKPLSEQPARLKEALKASLGYQDAPFPYSGLMGPNSMISKDAGGEEIYKAVGKERGATKTGAAEALKSAGIPGIKYLDAGSRGAGDGTRNYVVFDDKLISIIRKYGIAGASAMLGYNLMEQLDSKQALAATMADQDFQRENRSSGGRTGYNGGGIIDDALKLIATHSFKPPAAEKMAERKLTGLPAPSIAVEKLTAPGVGRTFGPYSVLFDPKKLEGYLKRREAGLYGGDVYSPRASRIDPMTTDYDLHGNETPPRYKTAREIAAELYPLETMRNPRGREGLEAHELFRTEVPTGSLSSNLYPEYKSLEGLAPEVRARLSSEDTSREKFLLDRELYALNERIRPYAKNPVMKEFASPLFFERSLAKVPEEGLYPALSETYNVEDLPYDLVKDINSFVGKYSRVPVPYFEMKVATEVPFEETGAVLVPSNAPDEVVSFLTGKAPKVKKYSSDEEYRDILRALGLGFSGGGIADEK